MNQKFFAERSRESPIRITLPGWINNFKFPIVILSSKSRGVLFCNCQVRFGMGRFYRGWSGG